MKIIFCFIAITLVLWGCKKESTVCPPTNTSSKDLLAPCTLEENQYSPGHFYNSVTISNESNPIFPYSNYQVTFNDSLSGASTTFAFKKEPETGTYSPRDTLNSETYKQVSIQVLEGTFPFNSHSSNDTIYVESNDNYLLISYCNFTLYNNLTGSTLLRSQLCRVVK